MSRKVGYVPPVMHLPGSSFAASASMSMADAELKHLNHHLKRKAGLESEEEAMARKIKQEQKERNTTLAYSAIAALTVVTSIGAMFVEASVIAYIAFIIPLFTAPLAVQQRRKLNKLPTLQEEHNLLRVDVVRLMEQNDVLQRHNDEIEQQISKLQHVESELNDIVQQQGRDTDSFTTLVKEQKEINGKIKNLLEAELFQDLFECILSSDRNEDFTISQREFEMLLLRMHNHPGFTFDEATVRAKFAACHSKSVIAVMDICRGVILPTKS
eukprot:scaffold195008_cov69-Attheya_sp.AAC.1